jgi:hypothetical protein
MKDVPSSCSKCGGNLAQGFSAQFIPCSIYAIVDYWVAGEPQKTWRGAKLPRGKDQYIPIAHFRCTNCGFLESYASPEFAMK